MAFTTIQITEAQNNLAAAEAATAAVNAKLTQLAIDASAISTALIAANSQRSAAEIVINQIVAEYISTLAAPPAPYVDPAFIELTKNWTPQQWIDFQNYIKSQQPPVVVTPPPVVVTPPTSPITDYPKRTTVVGATGSLTTYSEGMTVPGFGKITNGLLSIPDQNAVLPSNIIIKGAIVHTGSGVLTAANVREEGGYGHESYWRTNGTFNLKNCSAIRTGNSGLGSSVSHGYFAGNGAHQLIGCYTEGSQTGFSLGGGPDVNHPRLLLGCKAAELRSVGGGHVEAEFVGITGTGYYKSQFCHWEPSSRSGWQTAAAFMQPAAGECWHYLDKCFLAGQNISLYIESAYKATAGSWLPAAPPTGHPGHLYATNNHFGPQTSPSASWHTYLKSGFGDFAQWSNNVEVDANYNPTGKIINALASYKDVDSAAQNPTLTRVD